MTDDAPTLTFYDVRCDVDRFQYLLIDSKSPVTLPAFTGAPLAEHWRPPKVYSFQPRLREGSFWDVGLTRSAFAVTDDARQRTNVEYFLSGAGELLPLASEEQSFALLNITACYDALDKEATEWDYYPDGDVADVIRPQFSTDRLGWQLFKVPETALTRVYYWEHSEFAEDQFRLFCDREKLTGLIFEPIYAVPAPW